MMERHTRLELDIGTKRLTSLSVTSNRLVIRAIVTAKRLGSRDTLPPEKCRVKLA